MAYLIVESLLVLAAGVLFVIAARRIWSGARDKSDEVRRATLGYSSLWLTAAAGSFTLAVANLAAVLEWYGLDDVMSAASGLVWALAVIPFFYIVGYLVLQSLRAARISAACGGLLYAAGVWLAFDSPTEKVLVASHYTMHIFREPLAQVYTICAVVLPAAAASFFLYKTALQLEGTGRWRGIMSTVAIDVYVASMLVRVAWQDLAANVISRVLLLASALLIYVAYSYRRLPEDSPG